MEVTLYEGDHPILPFVPSGYFPVVFASSMGYPLNQLKTGNGLLPNDGDNTSVCWVSQHDFSYLTTQRNSVLAGSVPVDYWAAFRLNLRFKNPDSNWVQGEEQRMADREHQLYTEF